MITSFNRRFFLLCFSVCSFLILLRGEQCKEPRIIQFHRSDDKKRSSNLITFLQNNDIYDLDYLPRQATAFQQYKNTEVPTIYILNGDFLSPMKKTFDDGEAMVESLNRVWNGPSIFLVGNHEFDISSKEFIKRMNESNHPWILSNVNHLQTPDNKCLEEYIIIEVNDIPILAVIGLMTNDKKEFDPNIFQRVEIQDPFITAERLTKKIHDSYPGLPVIAQTHLSWEDDEKLASTGLFVAIFGGHDHHLETRRTNNSTIVKCYEDARYYCKVEVWYNLTQETTLISEITDITVTSYDNEDYSPDPSLSAFIQQIYKEIEPQNESCLFAIPEGSTLTTHKLRRQEGSMAKFLLSRFVDIFHADAALMSSGNIRGDRDYTDCGSILSLHALFPFSASKPIAINIPGYIIEEMITYSRRSAFLDPPCDNADFLQVDSRLEYDMKEKKVRSIASRSFQPDRTYRVVVNCLILGGSNGHQPLLDYYAKNEISTNSQCSDDLPSMFEILYHHFLNKGFSTLFQDHSFQQLDKDRSGAITIEELKEAFKVVNHFTLHDDLLQRMWEMVSLPMHDSLEEERKVTYDQYKKIMKNLLNVTIESLSSSSLPSSSAPQPPLLDLDESFWKSSATPEILRFSSL